MNPSAARAWLLGAVVLYLASLWLPAVQGPGIPTQTGLDMFRQGASDMLRQDAGAAWRDGVVAWFANPALWLALVLAWLKSRRAALAFAALSLVLALSSFSAAFVAASTGRSVPEFGFAAGFYVWLAAIVATLVGAGRIRD